MYIFYSFRLKLLLECSKMSDVNQKKYVLNVFIFIGNEVNKPYTK